MTTGWTIFSYLLGGSVLAYAILILHMHFVTSPRILRYLCAQDASLNQLHHVGIGAKLSLSIALGELHRRELITVTYIPQHSGLRRPLYGLTSLGQAWIDEQRQKERA